MPTLWGDYSELQCHFPLHNRVWDRRYTLYDIIHTNTWWERVRGQEHLIILGSLYMCIQQECSFQLVGFLPSPKLKY